MSRQALHFMMALLLLVGARVTFAQEAPSLDQLRQTFLVAYEKKQFLEASALGLYAIARGARDSSTLYDTACTLALIHDRDRAFLILNQAIDAGFWNAGHLKIDSDLNALHEDKRWKSVVAKAEKAEAKRREALSNPDRAPFVTEDIPRFWAAYDKAMSLPTEQRAAVFQAEYLDKASPGMKDWIQVRRVTAKSLVAFVNKSPRFFTAIRPVTLQITAQRPATLAAFRKFKALYPEALFPGTTFCIGAFYGGGTTSSDSLLMSGEMYALTPQTPVDELGSWQKMVLTPLSDISFTIVHEMIHFQQRYETSNQTLLYSCIQEGSADFLGELCSGSIGQFHLKEVFPYGDAHERELWERFQQDMDRTDRRDAWLYSGSGEGKRPDDLGYYMGYKICEAYYRNAADKKRAIYDILHIQDFKAFLKASRYAEKFAITPP